MRPALRVMPCAHTLPRRWNQNRIGVGAWRVQRCGRKVKAPEEVIKPSRRERHIYRGASGLLRAV
eukprot:1036410-Pleurochrysis_carterae.AAC.3